MFNISYFDEYFPVSFSTSINIDDNDITLTELFAYFVNMTEKIGYQPGSWETVFEDVNDAIKEGYSIQDWADCIIDNYIN